MMQDFDYNKRRAEIARQIRRARRAARRTQEQAAAVLGCSRVRLNRVERGLVDLSLPEAEKLAWAFGVSVAFFFEQQQG